MGRRGRVMETGGHAWRDSSNGRMDSPRLMYGGKKSGGIPWEQVFPAPVYTTQLRVPVLGR